MHVNDDLKHVSSNVGQNNLIPNTQQPYSTETNRGQSPARFSLLPWMHFTINITTSCSKTTVT